MSDIFIYLLTSFVTFVFLGFVLLFFSVHGRKKQEQKQAGGLGHGNVYKEKTASGKAASPAAAQAQVRRPLLGPWKNLARRQGRGSVAGGKKRVLAGDQSIKIPDLFAQEEPEAAAGSNRGRVVLDGRVVSGDKVRRDTPERKEYPVVGDGAREPDGSQVKTDDSRENYQVIDGSAAGDYGRVKTDEMPENYQVIREEAEEEGTAAPFSGTYEAGGLAAAWQAREQAESPVTAGSSPVTAGELKRGLILAAVLGKPRALKTLEEELY